MKVVSNVNIFYINRRKFHNLRCADAIFSLKILTMQEAIGCATHATEQAAQTCRQHEGITWLCCYALPSDTYDSDVGCGGINNGNYTAILTRNIDFVTK